MSGIVGPHQKIPCADAREKFLASLFDRLWDRYRSRVSYVAEYEQMLTAAGARFDNDHIAFRTIATEQPLCGVPSIARVFEAAGYAPAGVYLFTDKHLSAIHYQHPNDQFPKLFISELRSWELESPAQEIIQRTCTDQRPPIAADTLSRLCQLGANISDSDLERLVDECAEQFERLPWEPPEMADVQALSEYTQYGAWVLVHGYAVNHFTALVNSHQVASLDGIEETVAAMRAAGIPMKPAIEGEAGSKLRQSATEAAVIDVEVRQNGAPVTMEWTYAYFELAERNPIIDPTTGEKIPFHGFLGPQATNLFEMTRKS